MDKFANELKAAENGIVVFTSSTGNELSQEKDEWNNGAFTKALVEGLRGAAARRRLPVIMISDLQGYVSRRVKELTSGNQRPMMAMPKTVEDFPIAERRELSDGPLRPKADTPGHHGDPSTRPVEAKCFLLLERLFVKLTKFNGLMVLLTT